MSDSENSWPLHATATTTKKTLSEATVQWPLQGTTKLQEQILPHIKMQGPECSWFSTIQQMKAATLWISKRFQRYKRLMQQSMLRRKVLMLFASIDSQLGPRLLEQPFCELPLPATRKFEHYNCKSGSVMLTQQPPIIQPSVPGRPRFATKFRLCSRDKICSRTQCEVRCSVLFSAA